MTPVLLGLRLRILFDRLRLAVLADAEQALLQFAVGREPRRVHDPVDPAVDHDRDVVGHRGRDPDILLDDEHADVALIAEIEQNLFDPFDNDRRQALGRLVHDQEPRVEQERARNGEHLLLAAGELIAAIGAPFGETRKRFVDARDRPLRLAVAGGEAQMLIDGERRPQAPALRNVGKAEPRDLGRAAPDEFLAEETNRAAGDRREADDRFAQRGLAHAVAADEREDAVLELQVDALQRVAAAVIDVEAFDLQEVGGATVRHGRHPDTIPAPRDPPRSRAARLP